MSAYQHNQLLRAYSERQYGGRPEVIGKWLVTISTGLKSRGGWSRDQHGFSMDTTPQCLCVVDDFGDLVPVRGWM